MNPGVRSGSRASVAAGSSARGTSTAAPRLLLVVTEDWYFLSHRLELARTARARGFEVIVATGPGERGGEIEAAGLRHTVVPLDRRGKNPLSELRTILGLRRLIRSAKPDLIHLVAVKPVMWGNVAAALGGRPPVLSAVPGMGYLFLGGGPGRRLLRSAYETVFRLFVRSSRNGRVLVQNEDDAALLLERRMVNEGQLLLVTGSGVDVARYTASTEPSSGPLVVLSHTRMLWDKGISELVAAARVLRRRSGVPPFIVRLIGAPDPANPASIPEAQLQAWSAEGVVEWLGRRDDIPAQLERCHIACLPSYREGAPLSLLEAAAAARAIVTTDVPGCRAVVRHEDNGLLVRPRSVLHLADALERLMLDGEARRRFGRRGRERAEGEFSAEFVNGRIVSVYLDMISEVKAS